MNITVQEELRHLTLWRHRCAPDPDSHATDSFLGVLQVLYDIRLH